MKKILFSIVFLIIASNCFGQYLKTESDIRINLCQPKLTELGRSATFHFNYRYRISTDSDGKIKEIKQIGDFKKHRSYMDDKEVIPCINEWKLNPLQKFTVLISVGVTSADNFIQISNKNVEIKFIL